MKENDYKSSVPSYKFSDDMREQKKQLIGNPLMDRFAASRTAFTADPHRPLYHFTSPECRLNDPNGLCFWKGNWHLFYQAYPPENRRQHWGHAISKDLIHWEDLPYAIYPDPERCCYSGASLVEDDRVIAMYHGTTVGNMIALSDDDMLLNWEKLTGKAVIPNQDENDDLLPYCVFDPCIWKKDDYYYSLSAGWTLHEHTGGKIRADFLLKSKDLIDWEYLHEFVEGDRFTIIGDD